MYVKLPSASKAKSINIKKENTITNTFGNIFGKSVIRNHSLKFYCKAIYPADNSLLNTNKKGARTMRIDVALCVFFVDFEKVFT